MNAAAIRNITRRINRLKVRAVSCERHPRQLMAIKWGEIYCPICTPAKKIKRPARIR